MLSYAWDKGIPVWTAVDLLFFLRMKDEATFKNIEWDGSRLTFTIHSALNHHSGLTFMIPADRAEKRIQSILVEGKDTPFAVRRVKGSEYAFVTVQPGLVHPVAAIYENEFIKKK